MQSVSLISFFPQSVTYHANFLPLCCLTTGASKFYSLQNHHVYGLRMVIVTEMVKPYQA